MAVYNVSRAGLKFWILGILVIVAAAIAAGFYGASSLFGGSKPDTIGPELVITAAPEQMESREVPVRGRLVFPLREELTFNISGQVGRVLVKESDRVQEGQVLALISTIDVTALGERLAQARLDMDLARDALDEAKEEFILSPLEQAKLGNKVAKARDALKTTEGRLGDFQRDYLLDLANATKAEADAQVVLDAALEALDDHQREFEKSRAAAQDKTAGEEVVLDNAKDLLADFALDEVNDLLKAEKVVSDAEAALENAEDAVAAFIVTIGLNIAFAPQDDEPNEVLVDLQRLRVAEALARSDLFQAQDDLSKEQRGLDPLRLRELEAAVELAGANLALSTQTLTEELEGPDQLILAKREAAVEVAQAKLVQAKFELEEELLGPDQTELEVREKDVAEDLEELADLIEGPDPFLVKLRQTEVVSAQAKIDDLIEELAGSVVTAPFQGIISMVNAEVDDNVNKRSRVLEIIDPTVVYVDGTVDATDLRFVAEESRATVTIDTLPGLAFSGLVVFLAENPRTERGVVTYAVRIQVDLPPGTEVPISPSGVSVIVQGSAEAG